MIDADALDLKGSAFVSDTINAVSKTISLTEEVLEMGSSHVTAVKKEKCNQAKWVDVSSISHSATHTFSSPTNASF